MDNSEVCCSKCSKEIDVWFNLPNSCEDTMDYYVWCYDCIDWTVKKVK